MLIIARLIKILGILILSFVLLNISLTNVSTAQTERMLGEQLKNDEALSVNSEDLPWLEEEKNSSTDQNRGLKVTLNIFSGRPNPSYYLENQDLMETIISLFNEVEKNPITFNTNSVFPTRLGYAGFMIENPGNVSGFPPFVGVYKGNIEVKNGQKRFLKDINGALEEFLLNQAQEKGVVSDEVIDDIYQEIQEKRQENMSNNEQQNLQEKSIIIDQALIGSASENITGEQSPNAFWYQSNPYGSNDFLPGLVNLIPVAPKRQIFDIYHPKIAIEPSSLCIRDILRTNSIYYKYWLDSPISFNGGGYIGIFQNNRNFDYQVYSGWPSIVPYSFHWSNEELPGFYNPPWRPIWDKWAITDKWNHEKYEQETILEPFELYIHHAVGTRSTYYNYLPDKGTMDFLWGYKKVEDELDLLCENIPPDWTCKIFKEDSYDIPIPVGVNAPLAIVKLFNPSVEFTQYTDIRTNPSLFLYFYDIQEKKHISEIIQQQELYSWCIPIYFSETTNYYIITSPCYINDGNFSTEANELIVTLTDALFNFFDQFK